MHERRFNPEHLHKLDSAERREQLPPEKLLRVLPLEQNQTVVDLGAGTGYFTIPAASRVRKVLAVDVADEMITELKKRLQTQAIENVEVVKGEIEDLPVANGVAHHVIASQVLHEVEPLSAGLSQVYRVLQDNGYIFCIEWAKVDTTDGPPLWHRISLSDMEQALEKAGFETVYHEHPTQSHYLIVGRKR